MKKRYVALLRAISNVSMQTFRTRMEELGFTDVESYGMSGNLLFHAKGKDQKSLERRIAEEFATPAMIRTGAQLARIITRDPFGSSIYFLSRAPAIAKRKAFLELEFESKPPVIYGSTIFFDHPVHLKGKRATFDFERALGVVGTARSARVVRQILERL